MVIDLNFGLWHSGAKLSYLRYLTFKSLRHFHPHSRIQLFTSDKVMKGNFGNKQEFGEKNCVSKDYLNKLEDLGVEKVVDNHYSNFTPNHQSDIFRYCFLRDNGGFYLDTDQIILKSFKTLPLNKYKFIYSSYAVKSDFAVEGRFSPVGVLGATKDSKILRYVLAVLLKYYRKEDYNSLGPLMFRDVLKKIDMSEGFNAPSNYFYPAPICDYTKKIYDGTMTFEKDSYAVHWFGGYAPSQDFNRKYTEEFAKKSGDSISRFLREHKII